MDLIVLGDHDFGILDLVLNTDLLVLDGIEAYRYYLIECSSWATKLKLVSHGCDIIAAAGEGFLVADVP